MRPSSLYQIQTWDWTPRLPQETLYRLEKNYLRNIWQVDTDFFLGSKESPCPCSIKLPQSFNGLFFIYVIWNHRMNTRMHSSRMRQTGCGKHSLDQRQSPPPPCEQNDWQTGVETLPYHNFVAGGNKKDWNQLQMRQASLLKTLPNNSIINLFFSKSKSMRNSQHKYWSQQRISEVVDNGQSRQLS